MRTFLRDVIIASMGEPAYCVDRLPDWNLIEPKDQPFGDAPFNALWLPPGTSNPGGWSKDSLIEFTEVRSARVVHAFITDRAVNGGRAAALVVKL